MSDKLVTIGTFYTVVEATFALNQLEAEGVKAVLADTASVEVMWYLTEAIGGIKLQVMEEDADRAISILDSHDRELVDEGEQRPGGAVDADFDPEPDETWENVYESETDETVDRALRAARLGLIFLPLQVYSIWLLIGILLDRERLSPANRRGVRTAVILDMLVIVVFAIFAIWFASLLWILLLF